MPIELWPWVGKLFFTGWLTTLIFVPIGFWIDEAKPGSTIALILACLGIAPFVICAVTVVGWLLTNILIVIWR